MKSTSPHLLSKYQVSPDDTFRRLSLLDEPEHLKMWAGSVIWWNGGELELFVRFADECPCLTESGFEFCEHDLMHILERVGFRLAAHSWTSGSFSEKVVAGVLDDG